MAESSPQSTFASFFESWSITQQLHLEKLKSLSESSNNDDEECRILVSQVLSHYQLYQQEKTKLVNSDVFLCFSPPWLTPFERSLLWITGFKPSTISPLVKNSVGELLSDEQTHMIESVRVTIRREEREIERAMARLQECLAEPPMYPLMRKMGKFVDAEVFEFDTAIDDLKISMAEIVGNADDLRASMVRKVVEILNPAQCVKFLAAAAEFQIQARKLGSRTKSTAANHEDDQIFSVI